MNLSQYISQQKPLIEKAPSQLKDILLRETIAEALRIANQDQDVVKGVSHHITQEEFSAIRKLVPPLSSFSFPNYQYLNVDGYIKSLKFSTAIKRAEAGLVVEVDSVAMAQEISRLYKPNHVMFEVYADWCKPCKFIEKDILNNPARLSQLTQNRGIVFKLDRTKMSKDEQEKLSAETLPQLIFLNVKVNENREVFFRETGRISRGYSEVKDAETALEFEDYVKQVIRLAQGNDSIAEGEKKLKEAIQAGNSQTISLSKSELGQQLFTRIGGDKKRGERLLQEAIQEDRDGRYGAPYALLTLARKEKNPSKAFDYYFQIYQLPHHKDFGESGTLLDSHIRTQYGSGNKNVALKYYLDWIKKNPSQGFENFALFLADEPDKISWVRETLTHTVFRNVPIDLALKTAKEKPEKSEPLLDVILVVGKSSQFDELKRETAANSKQEAIVVFVDENNSDYEKIKKQYGNSLETPFILRLDAVISSSKVEEKIKIPPTSFTTLANFYSQQK